MDTRTRLGRRIKELRTEAQLSQNALAASAGLNRVFVGGLERGEHAASVDTLLSISRALGVKLADLLAFDDEQRNPPSPADLAFRRVRLLADGASPDELERFERIATEYFRPRSTSGRRAKGTRRGR